MLIYILKFSGCLLCFWAFYKLVLEREEFHTLKRFYLLGSLVVSAITPVITFTNYIEIPAIETPIFIEDNFVVEEQVYTPTFKDYLPQILWAIYGLGVLVFGIRFIKNITQLWLRVQQNAKVKQQYFTNVLLNENVHPHTWFRYIFLNKTLFKTNTLPQEVLLHEQTHAKQLHAVDILITELLLIVFWFNPLLYVIKKDIKLNHEFLADQAVLNRGFKATDYKKLLLAFSSQSKPSLPIGFGMANAINYSSIKKRFTIMNAKTSKTRMRLLSLLLLPLVGGIIYGFSTTKTEYIEVVTKPEITITDIELELDSKGNLTYKNQPISASEVALLKENCEDCNIKISAIGNLKPEVITDLTSKLKDEKINSFTICSYGESDKALNEVFKFSPTPTETPVKTINNKVKKASARVNTPEVSIYVQEGATKEEIEEYNKLARKYNNSSTKIYKLEDANRMRALYQKMTIEQRRNVEPLPLFPPPPPAPPKPSLDNANYYLNNKEISKSQFSRLNKDAIESISIIKKEGKKEVRAKTKRKAKNVYLKDGETSSNLIPPPPPKPEKLQGKPKTGFFEVNGKTLYYVTENETTKYFNRWGQLVNDKGEILNKIKTNRKFKKKKRKKNKPETGFFEVNGQTLYYITENGISKYFNRWGQLVDKQGNILNPEQTDAKQVIKGQVVSKVYKDDEVVSEFKTNNVNLQDPPLPPPPPKVPTLKQLAKRGGTFYYKGEEITLKKALKLQKNNKDINLLIQDIETKPIVKFSDEPISVGRAYH